MAPQPPLFPPAAFDRGGGLPSWDPSRTSNPSFDRGFLKAAFDGELHLVKKAAKVVGRGAEDSRLAEKLGAVRDGYGMGLLHTAALGGSLPMCRYLVEDIRLDIDDVGPMGETPLTVAIGSQNVGLVRYFLDQGAATMKHNDSGSTPLHLAAGAESCEIVELLLSKGAYVDALHLGGTALHSAARNGRDDIMKVLLDHHADHKIALGGTGYTALAIATVAHSLKCVKLLLEAGADVDGTCKETPLIIAAIGGSTDILKCLVLAGADANVRDSLGRAPIEIAAHSGRREDVEILFPLTSRIPNVRDWSVDGIIRHVKSACPSKKVMLASAKSKAREAFKNGNYYLAARIYKEMYVAEWETATTQIWDEDRNFDTAEFNAYWDRYSDMTRLRIINHPQRQDIPAPATRDTYPSYDISGSRQNVADMTLELHEEVANYRRQLSSTALLEPRPVHSFFTRIEGKLRAIYQAITCTRSTDVVLQQPQVRPPRHSTGQQQEPTQHRHQPRPRVDHQWMSRPPPPDQAGSSAWQHHHDPLSGYGFRPHPQQHGPPPSFVMHQHPTGAYGYRAPMSGHEASHSDSTFDSAPDGGHNTQDQVSQHITNWMDTYYSTPPPDPTQPTQPTQDTQYGEDGSWIPLRNVRPPNRYGWSTPPPPQPRRGRGRRG